MRPARVGRPLGEVSLALLSAAASGPGTVRELAARACVGFETAHLKAHVLVRSGQLQPLTDERPRVLGLPPEPGTHQQAFMLLERSFWEHAAPAGQE